MKKLFIHNPIFRIVSPILSGSLGYLLILLIHNNLEQILEQVLGLELLFCILLSYIIHETSRFSLLFFDTVKIPVAYQSKLVLQFIISVLLSIILVSFSVHLYFGYILDYSPNIRELIIFNAIFGSITSIYIALHLSHQFLYKENTKELAQELEKTEQIEESFRHFRKGLNPVLLFESLESLIVLLHQDPEEAEEFLDHFSSLYRYILSMDRKDLVPFYEEEKAIHMLVELFEHLPFRKTELHIDPNIQTYIIPGSMLQSLELIIRSSIASPKLSLSIFIKQTDNKLEISYKNQEKLLVNLSTKEFTALQKSYAYYAQEKIQVAINGKEKIIQFPLLRPYTLELEPPKSL